jgi:hypothetical protein
MSEQGTLFDDLSVSLNSRHWLYHRWSGIKSRCYNPKATGFEYYGGKGVVMADEWVNDFQSFARWSMENGATSDLQIDRIDGYGNYSPANCRWVSRRVNLCNRPPKKEWNWSAEARANYQRVIDAENVELEADIAEWSAAFDHAARINYGRGMSRDELEILWRSKSRGRVPLAVFLRRVSFGWWRLRDALSIPARSKRFSVDPATVRVALGESEAPAQGATRYVRAQAKGKPDA